MSVKKFYSMISKSSKKWAAARAEKGFDRYALWDSIESIKSPDQWTEINFSLDEGKLTDLPPTDVIGRVCSPKLVEVLKQFNAEIMWLPVRLRRKNAEYVYYFMHFTSIPSVLDEDKTVYGGGTFMIPHISLSKAGQLPLFSLRPLGKSTFVRGDVKDAIEKAGCVGIEFEKEAAS